MDVTEAGWYAGGLLLLLVALQVLAKPLAVCLRLVGSSVAGGLVLWGLNLVGGLAGFHVGLNPVSAAIVGLLGLPGLLSLGLVRWILG